MLSYDLGEVKHRHGGATVVFGGQVGSEGKGAIAGHVARERKWGAAICAFMVNAGHTWVDEDGYKVMVQQLPISLVNPEIPLLLIAPGAGIHVPTLLAEVERYENTFGISKRLRIHPRAVIIEQRHAEMFQEHSIARAGVGKGCSRANAEKSMRHPTVKLARDVPELREFIADTTDIVNRVIDMSQPVLVEGAQGFDLDINHGFDYPHCTSRQTTPTQVLADCGIDGKMLTRSIAVIRSYPIRVGNIEKDGQRLGYSGDFPGQELTWDEVAARAGVEDELTLVERTTVTKRVRRVFEISLQQVERMSRVCRPTEVALTFADYIDANIANKGDEIIKEGGLTLYPKVQTFLWDLGRAISRSLYRPRVTMLKTGPQENHIVHLPGYGGPLLWQNARFQDRSAEVIDSRVL